MANVNVKRVKEQCDVMQDAWSEGAKTVDFNGITRVSFKADIDAAAVADDEIGDLEAQLKLKREARDDMYAALDEKRSKVGQGVAGNADSGDDSPLYGAMGFVRKSERKSGLTKKTKQS